MKCARMTARQPKGNTVNHMRRDEFVLQREGRWRRLESLLGRGVSWRGQSYNARELEELRELYTGAASDLVFAGAHFPEERVTLYLRELVRNAHTVVNRRRPISLKRIRWFLLSGFPEAYRTAGPYIATAFGISFAAALISAGLVITRPSTANALLFGQAEALRHVMQHHHLWMKSATQNHSVAANYIMLNNIQVAFLAFAGGMLIGLGTLFVLIMNGVNLGVVAVLVAQYGLSEQLWSFVVPHGVIELSVIFTAGGAGLMIGHGILRRVFKKREDALTSAARHAAYLILGCVPLLAIAGTIEGFFSPSDAPDLAKYVFGLVAGSLLYTYLLFPRHQRDTANRMLGETQTA